MLTLRLKKTKNFLNWINNPLIIGLILILLLANLIIAGFILSKISSLNETVLSNNSKFENIEAKQAELKQGNEFLQSSLMRMESMLYRMNSSAQN